MSLWAPNQKLNQKLGNEYFCWSVCNANNFTIFSASNFDQTSGSIEEAKHGMFSYYLMKGLEGKADGNKDKQITNGELIAYLKTNVSKEAFTQNREQDPMLSGDPDQVLMRY